ncbi:MAG: geranylgeranylglyceryl phosphate synthase family protein, partial [Cytophagia bacterium]|nr:geranylgeranylglyceryl phosphate synthase family protein [Cytophagia bacterium]
MACSKVNLSQRNSGDPGIWVLLDPDRFRPKEWETLLPEMDRGPVQGFLVGGSLQTTTAYQETLDWLAEHVNLPVVLFPGSMLQVSSKADALLLLSLISGRNPEYLIGHHVQAAVLLRNSGLKILPTGYLLVDGGKGTTAHYITQTQPIPADKPEIAAVTALAGTQLGLQIIYLDCGSGALAPVPTAMVQAVRQVVDGPLARVVVSDTYPFAQDGRSYTAFEGRGYTTAQSYIGRSGVYCAGMFTRSDAADSSHR